MIPRTGIGIFWLLACLATMTLISRDLSAQAQTNPDVVRHTPSLEFTGGMITGDRVGAAFESNAGGLVGGGLVFPVAKRLDLRAQYLYSNLDRRFVAFPGSPPQLPSSITLTASNLHIVMGSADVALRHWEKGKLYISPGFGLVRNAARELVFAGSGYTSSGPNPAGNAPFASLGIGYWARASDRVGVKFELRHFVSAGGTGEIPIMYLLMIGLPRPSLANMPIQNNVAFTVSFTFRLR